MTAQKLLRKGCPTYLANVSESKEKKIELKYVTIVREFLDVFPKELLGLPPEREVEMSIEVNLGTVPIAQAPYKMTPTELVKLKI
jgi:hypothetical protein